MLYKIGYLGIFHQFFQLGNRDLSTSSRNVLLILLLLFPWVSFVGESCSIGVVIPLRVVAVLLGLCIVL